MEPGRRSPKPRNSCNSRVRWASKAERKSGTGGASFLRVIILSESRLDPGEASSPNSYVAHLTSRGVVAVFVFCLCRDIFYPVPTSAEQITNKHFSNSI